MKVELLHGMQFGTRRAAKDEVMDWLQFYNHRRLHSTLGYLSPMNFEKARVNEKGDLARKKLRPHSKSAKGDVKLGRSCFSRLHWQCCPLPPHDQDHRRAQRPLVAGCE